MSKYQLFESKIRPLMDEIADVCEAHDVNMLAHFELDSMPEPEGDIHAQYLVADPETAGIAFAMLVQRINELDELQRQYEQDNPQTLPN